MIWFCGGHGVCTGESRARTAPVEGEPRLVRALAEARRSVDTGPAFEWITDTDAHWHSAQIFPPVRSGTLRASGSGSLPLTPGTPSGALIAATPSEVALERRDPGAERGAARARRAAAAAHLQRDGNARRRPRVRPARGRERGPGDRQPGHAAPDRAGRAAAQRRVGDRAGRGAVRPRLPLATPAGPRLERLRRPALERHRSKWRTRRWSCPPSTPSRGPSCGSAGPTACGGPAADGRRGSACTRCSRATRTCGSRCFGARAARWAAVGRSRSFDVGTALERVRIRVRRRLARGDYLAVVTATDMYGRRVVVQRRARLRRR